jgi:hypothetical protein
MGLLIPDKKSPAEAGAGQWATEFAPTAGESNLLIQLKPILENLNR